MADRSKSTNDPAAPDGPADVNDRVQELTWALVDEQVTDDETQLLDTLLISDDSARDTYIGCIQLHVDLMHHYGALSTEPQGAKAGSSPVLGFLNDPAAPFASHRPTAEDSRS